MQASPQLKPMLTRHKKTLLRRYYALLRCYIHVYMNIALRRFLHNHGNIATEGSPKPGLCPTLISGSL